MCRSFLFFLFFVFQLNGDIVHIVSPNDIYSTPMRWDLVEKHYTIHHIHPKNYMETADAWNQDLKKIIVFNNCLSEKILCNLPKNKLIQYISEPYHILPRIYDYYSRVYTWDDTIVDNKKFFKIHNFYLMPMEQPTHSFEEKKLLVMVASNWVNHRIEIAKYFLKNHQDDLEIYGRLSKSKLKFGEMHKGEIPGHHTGKEKIMVLQKYRFCLCFENTIGLQGYITEKIFGCFTAGCVPIYWGSDNIQDYIPKGCYIDYRDFLSKEEMYRYIKHLSKEEHEQYILNIRAFTKSEEAKIFTPLASTEKLLQAINS